MPVIGFLNLGSPDTSAHLLDGFRRGLADAGYVETRDVAIEYPRPTINTTACRRWPPNLVSRRVICRKLGAAGRQHHHDA
jgi:hypothetical protein